MPNGRQQAHLLFSVALTLLFKISRTVVRVSRVQHIGARFLCPSESCCRCDLWGKDDIAIKFEVADVRPSYVPPRLYFWCRKL